MTDTVPKVVASIEARMGSSRLPGKVLKLIGGVPALARMIRRVKKAESVDQIVVATSDQPADGVVAELAEQEGVAVFRGSETDVLDRVLGAHDLLGSDIIVELCGDCPLVDPVVIDHAVALYINSGVDLVTTTRPQSYPQGIDAEVFSRSALQEIADSVLDPAVREHVSLQFYREPGRYRIANLEAPPEARAPNLRLLLDYPRDLEALNHLWRALEARFGEGFSAADIVSLVSSTDAFYGLWSREAASA